MDWEPVLRGDLAVVARNRLLAILTALARLDVGEEAALEGADRMLLGSYLAAAGTALPSDGDTERLLDADIPPLPADLPSGMFNGLTSIGWTVQHCAQLFGPPDVDEVECQDPLEDLERLVLARLRVESWTESYDLVSGLVGIGVYCLERLPLSSVTWRGSRRPTRPARRGTRPRACCRRNSAKHVPTGTSISGSPMACLVSSTSCRRRSSRGSRRRGRMRS
jgi:hypothetical protein